MKQIFKTAIHSIENFWRFLLRSILRSIFLSCDRLRAIHFKNLRFVAPLADSLAGVPWFSSFFSQAASASLQEVPLDMLKI